LDLDSHLVERWRPDDARPEIVTDVIDWRAPDLTTSIVFDLVPSFAECDGINAAP
jgi:hypothetical protein